MMTPLLYVFKTSDELGSLEAFVGRLLLGQ